MTAAAFVACLEELGIRLRIEGGELAARGSPNALFRRGVLAELHARRDEVLAHLRSRRRAAGRTDLLEEVVEEWRDWLRRTPARAAEGAE